MNVGEATFLGRGLCRREISISVLRHSPFAEIANDLYHPVLVRTCAAADFFEADYVGGETVVEGFGEDYGSYRVVSSCHPYL